MSSKTESANLAALPEELVPLLGEKTLTCEFASIKGDGTPINAPLVPYLGENGRTVDLATGLAYPLKADRARKNPKVSLLYAEPLAALIEDPPVILIQGQATIYDADLQANFDRFMRLNRASETFAKTPSFLIRWLSGYLARIWISVTPLKVLWWPQGDLSRPPEKWLAPPATQAPPSDPPPKPLARPHKAIVSTTADWRTELEQALLQMGRPTLTVVDEDGYPAPFRVAGASLDDGGARLVLPGAMPTKARGRACLNFYTLQVKDDEMVANETVSFIGHVTGEDDEALFAVERQLPNLNIRSGFRGTISNVLEMRRIGKRAEAEAARRGQSPPQVRL